MTNEIFAALRDAVNLSRSLQIRSVHSLRAHLYRAGHSQENIQQAITFWAKQVRANKF